MPRKGVGTVVIVLEAESWLIDLVFQVLFSRFSLWSTTSLKWKIKRPNSLNVNTKAKKKKNKK